MENNKNHIYSGMATDTEQSADAMLQTDADDQLLRQFMAAYATDVPDGGFRRRVMTRLPDAPQRRLNRIWIALCTLMGVVVFVAKHGWDMLLGMAQGLRADLLTHDWAAVLSPLALYMTVVTILIATTGYALANSE